MYRRQQEESIRGVRDTLRDTQRGGKEGNYTIYLTNKKKKHTLKFH